MPQIKPFPRAGAWAVDADGRVGILFQGVLEEFHVVDAAGDTALIAVVPWGSLSQASISDIPAARRGASDEALARLGYEA